jgi:predicted ferric reductase
MPFWLDYMETFGNFFLTPSFVIYISKHHHHHRYELFVYTHYLMALFFILSFLHSFQSWYYSGAGLILYGFDKVIRAVNQFRQHTVTSLVHHKDAGVTQIVLPGDTFAKNGSHSAGQFCWVNFPAVSTFEWHPFTISSSPCMSHGPDGKVMFSIKALTPGSWTHRLGELGAKYDNDPASFPLPQMDIAFDGPYGRSFDYSAHKTVVLVAGISIIMIR